MQFVWRLSPSGGVPRVARTLLSGIDRDRFDVHVCSARPLLAEDALAELGPGLTWHTLGLTGAVPAARRARAAVRLASLIRQSDPDVVHTHSGMGWYLVPWLVVPRRRATPLLEVHDSPQSARVSGIANRVERAELRRLGVVPLVHSRSVGRELAAADRLDPAGVVRIPIGIEQSGYGDVARGMSWRRSRGIAADEPVVTYIARLVRSKNPLLFVQVAADVLAARPGARFVLVGDGPERNAVAAEAGRLSTGDRLLLAGHEHDLAAVLAGTDVFLSTSDYEGFGIAILEAMASAVPVVSTAVGGTDELIVTGETGLVAEPGDTEGLVRATLALLDDPATRRRMGDAGRTRAATLFDARTMVAAYEQLYERMASPT